MILESGGDDLRLAEDRDDPGMLARRHEDTCHLVAEVDGEGAVGVVVGQVRERGERLLEEPGRRAVGSGSPGS